MELFVLDVFLLKSVCWCWRDVSVAPNPSPASHGPVTSGTLASSSCLYWVYPNHLAYLFIAARSSRFSFQYYLDMALHVTGLSTKYSSAGLHHKDDEYKGRPTVFSAGWAAVEWVHRLRLKHPNTIPLSHGGRDCSANSILTFLQCFKTVLHMSTTIFSFDRSISPEAAICLSKRKESCSSLPSVGLRFFFF